MGISKRRFSPVTKTAEIKPQQCRWHHTEEGQCRIPPTNIAGINEAVTKPFISRSPSKRRIRIGDDNKVVTRIGTNPLTQRFEKGRQKNVSL